jgi:hypothetical protein
MKKVSRCLLTYLLWLLSYVIFNNNYTSTTDKVLMTYFCDIIDAKEDNVSVSDDNWGTGIRPDGYEYGDYFLPVGDTRTWSELRWIWSGYFFPPAGNPTGTRYFTTAIILGCEQVKMCLFCYINYVFLIVELCYFVISNIYWILILKMCILCFAH